MEYSIQIIKFKKCDKKLRINLLHVFYTCFDDSMDPCFYDETIVKILYYDNKIVGMICGIDNYELLKFNNADSYYIEKEACGLFIYNLCIIKSHRKKKLGKLLLKLFINKYSKFVNYFHTQIFENNLASRCIFSSHGFTEKRKLTDNESKTFFIYSFHI